MGQFHNHVPSQKMKGGENGYMADCLVGIRGTKHGDSRYLWAVFNRKDVPQHLIDMHLDKDNDYDLAFALTEWEGFYSGVGRLFASDPYCKIYRNRILVIQHCGLDI